MGKKKGKKSDKSSVDSESLPPAPGKKAGRPDERPTPGPTATSTEGAGAAGGIPPLLSRDDGVASSQMKSTGRGLGVGAQGDFKDLPLPPKGRGDGRRKRMDTKPGGGGGDRTSPEGLPPGQVGLSPTPPGYQGLPSSSAGFPGLPQSQGYPGLQQGQHPQAPQAPQTQGLPGPNGSQRPRLPKQMPPGFQDPKTQRPQQPQPQQPQQPQHQQPQQLQQQQPRQPQPQQPRQPQPQQPQPQPQQPRQPQPQQPKPQQPQPQQPRQPQPQQPQQPQSQQQPQPQQLQLQQSKPRGPLTVGQPSPAAQPVTPVGDTLSEEMSKMKIAATPGTHLQIPHRKRFGPIVGRRGRQIVIEVNHLQLQLKKTNIIAIHYDVSFKPDLPKKMLRFAMEAFRKKNFPRSYPAFDGRKNLYSCGKLPFGNEIRDTVVIMDEERQRDKEFDITIKFASQVDMSALSTYLKTGNPVSQEVIQALDIVLRNPASLCFTPVGRSFFTPPKGQVIDLGDGLELWYGFYQSAILGWKPYLNIDVAHKGFPSAKSLVEIVMNIRQSNNLSTPLESYEKQNLEKFIKGLKVEYQILNQPNTKRTYKVNSIKGSAVQERFKLENGTEMSVAEYFSREKRVNLRFPAMPCIHVGNIEKTIYLPLEFCRVAPGQVVNHKLNDTQTAAMVRAAAKPADVRKSRILDAMRQANFNADKCIQEFGITVSQEFTKVGARILDPPRLEYYNNESVTPKLGVWRASKFFKSNCLKDWVILNLDGRTREDALWDLARMMTNVGKRLGIDIAKPADVRSISTPRGVSKQAIIDYFQSAKNKQLIVVIINDRDVGIYGRVKQSAELCVGVLTQCIKSKTMSRMNDATCSNILLKINSKLNGVNHQIDKSCRPEILRRPVMIIGADVTHPSPDAKNIPSVAAVAASHDPTAFQYNMLWRLQPPRQEMIEDLEEMMKLQLRFFYKKTKLKPEKIVFYRDGVSEGQFAQVLNTELKAIRRACTALDPSYKPPITFLVVQKRHHTRFFPTNPRDEDGRNKNVPAGTIVDTEITHPKEMDFYLVSHASLQGTSRPTKYHKLWDDNNIDEDDLEELTYYLCHLFSRCTRSVSYPAPTYYAHLAAFRARSYIEGSTISMTNLSNEQRQRTIHTNIVDNSPMFFV